MISGLDSECPGSSLDVTEGELKTKDDNDRYTTGFDKKSMRQRENKTQHSGGSTMKDSQFYATSGGFQDHPTSAIDNMFSSEID